MVNDSIIFSSVQYRTSRISMLLQVFLLTTSCSVVLGGYVASPYISTDVVSPAYDAHDTVTFS